MVKRILLVGCGIIGSRHLQAIAKLEEKTEIDVVEPKDDAIKQGKNFLKEVSSTVEHNYHWYGNLNEVTEISDLAIIATRATGRINLINQLLEKGHSRFFIEKMVCQSKNEYEEILSNMNKHKAKGWVDTGRRYFSSYQKLKKIFEDDKIINMSVFAGYAGLGRDAIHFIDLFSWFCKNSQIKLDGKNLLNDIYSSPRGDDFVEFAGTITGSCNDSFLSLTFVPDCDCPILVNIFGKNHNYIIDESHGRIFNPRKDDDDFLEFKTEYSSDLTKKIILDIFHNDCCNLPTVLEISYAHNELFRIFNTHLKNINNDNRELCPIT